MSQPENQPQQPQNDLASELRELGQQLENSVRSALQSEKARQIQHDVAIGMQEIGSQVQSALKSIQENPKIQQLIDRGEQTLSQAQQSHLAQDFQESLARGISQLNAQLSAFIARTRADGPPATGGSSDAPATGETERLDPNQK
jgi:DNA replication protein DnaD